MKRLIISLLLMFLTHLISPPAFGQENSLRIEQEGKLLVPQDQAEKLWQYLLEQRFETDLAITNSEEIFSDVYYDTHQLLFLDQNSSIRHRQRENLTNPEDRKSDKELVQIKLNTNSNNQLNRGEYKFEVDLTQAGISDQHPLLAIIKKSQRNNFIDQLYQLGTQVNSLRPILKLSDRRRRIYFTRQDTPILTLSLDQVTSKRLWVKAEFIELETELNEITYTESSDADRKILDALNKKIIEQILIQFPDIILDLTPKYNKSFYLLEKQIPFFRWLIRWNLI